MFCENCGNKLPDDALFCNACGHKVSMPEKIATQQPVQQLVQSVPQSQQNQLVNQPAMPQGMQEQHIRVEKKPMQFLTKLLIAEVAVFVVLAGVFYTKMKEYTSPETTAKAYFSAVMAGEQKRAYDMIEVGESGFINEKFFGKVLKQIGCKNVNNFKVEELKKSSDDYAKNVKITYRLKEDTEDYNFYVKLEKTNTKAFLLFDKWKVNIGDYIQKDVALSVIKDSKVTFEGEKLGKKYLSDEQDEDNKDVYIIPKMFYGTYQTVITNDVYTDCQMDVEISEEENSFYENYEDVSIKSEILQQVMNQSEKDFKALWDGAASNQDFARLVGVPMAQDTTDIQENYTNLADKFKSEDGTGLKSMNFGNFQVTAVGRADDIEDSVPSVNVEFTAAFTCTNTEKNWWTDELEESSGSGDYRGSLYYIYEDGKWVLSDLSLAGFYF